ncbi:MAG TPA: hypothetical protein VKR52_19270 [Terracidiphilus sp.]|nr:hypothetical protein [Terracidiphilus sp.]
MRVQVAVVAALLLAVVPVLSQDTADLKIDYSNPGLTPSHWVLEFHPDGTGHFHSERGNNAPVDGLETMEPGSIDRDIQLEPSFAAHMFDIVRRHRLFKASCESHMKVAFQGWKKISYSGPDGQGTCEFNFAKDHEIENMGESLVAVAATVNEGARLQLILQHDPLGLDKEMQFLLEGSGDGRLQQVCTISGILKQLEDDPSVMDRVRRRARMLLEQADKN